MGGMFSGADELVRGTAEGLGGLVGAPFVDKLSQEEVKDLFRRIKARYKLDKKVRKGLDEDENDAGNLWPYVKTVNEFRLMQLLWFYGLSSHTPWYNSPNLDAESKDIRDSLLEMNRLGFITAQSQPAQCTSGYNDETRKYYEIEQKPWVEGFLPIDMLQSTAEAMGELGYYVTTSLPLLLDFGPMTDKEGRWLDDKERSPAALENLHQQRRQIKKHHSTEKITFPQTITHQRSAARQLDLSRTEWEPFTRLRFDNLSGNAEIDLLHEADVPAAEHLAKTHGYIVVWGSQYCEGNALFAQMVDVLKETRQCTYIDEASLADQLQEEQKESLRQREHYSSRSSSHRRSHKSSSNSSRKRESKRVTPEDLIEIRRQPEPEEA